MSDSSFYLQQLKNKTKQKTWKMEKIQCKVTRRKGIIKFRVEINDSEKQKIKSIKPNLIL